MSPEENEITLIVQCYDLSTLKLWELGKGGLKYASTSVAKSCHKSVQDELWVVGCCSSVALYGQVSLILDCRASEEHIRRFVLSTLST
jgi:hypothetical protein